VSVGGLTNTLKHATKTVDISVAAPCLAPAQKVRCWLPNPREARSVTLAPWTSKPGYLNTASFGIPAPQTIMATRQMIDAWEQGGLTFGSWFAETQHARQSIARLFAVSEERVALGTSTAAMLGSIAANLPDGARVLAPENEHNSNLIPYLNQAHRGVTVTLVPLAQLAGCVDATTTLVSCSAVQSLTGEVADIETIKKATRDRGALFCLDGSQACGWLPLSGESADVIVCSVYKWLCAPIGGAFLVTRPDIPERFRPASPGWPATMDPAGPPYGTDVSLASTARRFDSAPNLISMIGLRRSVDEIVALGVSRIHEHDVTLANLLRDGLDMAPSNSAIVTLPLHGAAALLAQSGIRATEWRGNLRLSFHVYNSAEDVERTLEALRSLRK
jgi:selenocysteine lyase/cysteine desulfurase